ncbi:TetR family transcriptional regulator [Mesorhizobium sp. 1B3]|uniref:TetR family transcriptional regulator n=1 Tax=Mesorhizobium sp. 1B3 TaxID=3243599 RepID=UPI003D96C745
MSTTREPIAAKRPRNPEATKASILAAARAEFAERGLDGGRVDSIARRAGANKQLVYYYFGSKDEIYRAALEASYADIRSLERELDLAALPPREAMIRLIDFSLDYLAQHREFIRMLADENAHGARHVRNSDAARQTNSPLLEMIAETLRRGEKEGIFRTGVDPLELYVSIAGMTFFYFANGLTMSAIFGRDLTQPEAISSYRDHIVSFTLAGLRP